MDDQPNRPNTDLIENWCLVQDIQDMLTILSDIFSAFLHASLEHCVVASDQTWVSAKLSWDPMFSSTMNSTYRYKATHQDRDGAVSPLCNSVVTCLYGCCSLCSEVLLSGGVSTDWHHRHLCCPATCHLHAAHTSAHTTALVTIPSHGHTDITAHPYCRVQTMTPDLQTLTWHYACLGDAEHWPTLVPSLCQPSHLRCIPRVSTPTCNM